MVYVTLYIPTTLQRGSLFVSRLKGEVEVSPGFRLSWVESPVPT